MTHANYEVDPMLDALIAPDTEVPVLRVVTSPPMTPELAKAAQAHLAQVRANDRSSRPPAARPATTVADLLGRVAIAVGVDDQAYPTAAQMTALAQARSVPAYRAAICRALHDRECTSGRVIMTTAPGEYASVACPHCQATAADTRMREELKACGIQGRYLDPEWADLELHAPLDRIAEKCANIHALVKAGASLLLFSEQTGCGKTQSAMLIGKAAKRAGYTVRVVNLARLAVDVRDGFGVPRTPYTVTEKAAIRQMAEPDLLILDDLGASEGDTASIERRILGLALEERQNHNRPTVVTTNLPLAAPEGSKAPSIASIFGARVLARLQPLTALHVNHGVNFRARKSEVSW